MKKLLLLLLLAPLCVAQTTHTFGALNTDNVWTGNDTFLRLVPGHGTVSHLPPLPLPWMVFIVTDGTGPGDCSQGGGTDKHWCGYNDVLSAWVALGGGGGGGGGTPCGTLYDVQLNQPTGFFGCDTGIFQHNTVTHVTSTQTMQATQEVDVSDSTHNGLVDWGFSNGSTILAHFKLSLGPSFSTTNGGYFVNFPNGPAINKPWCLTSLTPEANGGLPSDWCTPVSAVSGTANQIDVATGTTTPVISLSSTLVLPGTMTMGAHAADFNAATLFTVPVSAGATSSANGVIAYDTTAKSFHFRVNNADAIGAAFASAPGGSKCLHTNGVTGLITESAADCGAGTPIATDSTQGTIETKTCTNQFFRAIVTGTGVPTCASIVTADLPSQYAKLRCETGLGDGLNAMAAGTYLQTFCYNDSGVTWTLTGLKCFTDNSGASTMNASNGAGTGLLTGAVTCTSSFAAGTQSGTTTIANGDYIKFTFVADGTSKQTTWVVSITQ